MSRRCNSFDIDGVIYLGEFGGVYPGPSDIIITGRSFEEADETLAMLRSKGIHNEVFFNPLPFAKKTRISSGEHKARVINQLKANGRIDVAVHFEDDPVQILAINANCPGVKTVMLVHDLVEKENIRHDDWQKHV